MKVLAIDSARPVCTVAVWNDGVLHTRESANPRAHAEQILPLVDDVLADAGVSLHEIDRFAFGRGPGGLTGVRVAASAVHAFAFVAGRPLVAVSNLRAAALAAVAAGATPPVAVCLDAGAGQVATGCYAGPDLMATEDEKLQAPDAVEVQESVGALAGNGVGALGDQRPPVYTVEAGAAAIAELAARPDAELLSPDDPRAQPRYFRHPVYG